MYSLTATFEFSFRNLISLKDLDDIDDLMLTFTTGGNDLEPSKVRMKHLFVLFETSQEYSGQDSRVHIQI